MDNPFGDLQRKRQEREERERTEAKPEMDLRAKERLIRDKTTEFRGWVEPLLQQLIAANYPGCQVTVSWSGWAVEKYGVSSFAEDRFQLFVSLDIKPSTQSLAFHCTRHLHDREQRKLEAWVGPSKPELTDALIRLHSG